jgi:long-chain acyl-CoA synthetase
MNIEELLFLVPRIEPSAPSVESGGHWWNWAEVAAVSDAVRGCLDQAGCPVGARIGVLLRNRAPHLASLIACVASGRCAVAFNPLAPPAKLAQDVRAQKPVLLIGARQDIEGRDVQAVAFELGVPLLLLPEQPGGGADWLGEWRFVPQLPADALRLDTMVEMLSSGTTGPPKRIPLARSNFNQSFRSAQAYEKDRGSAGPVLRSGVRLQTAPLTHISGLFTGLMTFAEGRKLVLLEKFSVDSWVAAVERTRPRIGNLPPAALRMILDANVPKARLESLIALRSGTAPLDPSVIEAFQQRYGLPVLVQYGATEFAGSVAGWEIQAFKDLYRAKRGSVGRIQAGLEARVVDADSGETLPYGTPGVLELRGQQLGDKDRWVRTTDRASLDSDQYLWIHGRADNAINRGGFKIHPDEVTQALQEHSAIREAAVVGIPDPRLGETPAAAIILASGHAAPDVAQLRAFLGEKLLPYQIPSLFLFVEELPRTPSLKPSLPDIRRLFATKSEAPV